MDMLYSKENLVKKYKEPIDSVITGLQEILQKRLISVYGCGSWIRNETRKDSDIDFFFVINSYISEEEKDAVKQLEKNILQRWSHLGFTGVDIRFVNEKDEDNYFTIAHKEIIQIDGCLLYGTAFTWDIYHDYSTPQIVEAFNKIATYIYKNLLKPHDADLHVRERSRRSLVKTLLRTLEWLAVLKGAPISHSMDGYIDHIKMYIPEFTQTVETTMKIYKKEKISDSEVSFLDDTLMKVLK